MAIQVRVTQEPGVVREVDEAEFTDLSRQGLIHSHNIDGVKSPKKWVPKDRGADVIVAPPAITEPPATAADDSKKKGA